MWGALIEIFKIGTKATFVIASIFAFLAMLGLIMSAMNVSTNGGVLADIYAIVAMWLPFNLNVVILWLVTAALVYLTYRLTVVAVVYVDKLLSS